MVDLGTLPGDSSSEALDINDSGEVVGYSSGPEGMRAVVWTRAKGMQSLGTLPGGNYSKASGVNRSGQVVGTAATSSGNHTFIWTSSDGMRDLGTLPGDSSSEAVDVTTPATSWAGPAVLMALVLLSAPVWGPCLI